MVLLAASEVRTLAQIFDLTNAVPLTNGPLYVDLRAVNAASGVWANFGSLGNFMPVGNPTLIRNVAGETAGFGTGIPGVAFDGANDAYQGPNSVSNIDGSSDRSIEVWALNP